MSEFVLEHYTPMCLDFLMPNASYFGLLSTEESFNKIVWVDERPKPTWAEVISKWPEVQAAILWERYKSDRMDQLARSTVEVSGMVFDADEDSQNRMARAIVIMSGDPEVTSVRWRLSNNTEAQVDLATMRLALKAAAAKQTDLWFPPA